MHGKQRSWGPDTAQLPVESLCLRSSRLSEQGTAQDSASGSLGPAYVLTQLERPTVELQPSSCSDDRKL